MPSPVKRMNRLTTVCLATLAYWVASPVLAQDLPPPASTPLTPPDAPAPAPPSPDQTAPPTPADQAPPPTPLATVAAPGPVKSAALRAPDLFSATPGPTGLPDTLWAGASADLARAVIPMAAGKPLSPAAASFAQRLFATGGQAPDDAGADADLAAARIGAVLALGDAASAQAMLAHTPGVAASPALSQVAAEADLVLGQEDQACQVGDALTQGKDQPYFRRLRAYCLVRPGANDAAQLAFDLADSQARDAVYKRLMSAALSSSPPGAASMTSGLVFALSKHLQLDLTSAVADGWRPILVAVAKDPASPDALRQAALARLQPAVADVGPVAAPVLGPLQAGDLKAARAARALIERNDQAGATVLELALIDAALTTAEGQVQQTVMDQLVERGAAGDPVDRLRAQQAAALYGALGAPMSGQERGDFASFDLGHSSASQARMLELQLAKAPGDKALLILWLAADAGAAGPPPVERAEIVHVLMQTGFVRHARDFALEGFVELLMPAPPAPQPRAPARRRRRFAQ